MASRDERSNECKDVKYDKMLQSECRYFVLGTDQVTVHGVANSLSLSYRVKKNVGKATHSEIR